MARTAKAKRPHMPRRDRPDAADPAHRHHRSPVWDVGDVARFCRCHRQTVWDWVTDGWLVATETRTRTDGRIDRRFSPADVIAQTAVRRVPTRA